MTQPIRQNQTFEEFLAQARHEFQQFTSLNYSVDEHLKLRTAVDSFFIAYDQAVNEIATLRARVAELEKAAEPEPTTVRGWLERLPDGYRERALRQCVRPDEPSDSIISAAFIFNRWCKTSEGADFWIRVYYHYRDKEPLPPLPNETKA
jgi:hypothetical protein